MNSSRDRRRPRKAKDKPALAIEMTVPIVELWDIDRLIPYENNPRNNDQAVDRMAQMIVAYGFRIPIVAKSDGRLYDGHLRLKAARKLGMAQVPVMLADDMTEEQIKTFRLAVNKTAEWATWDDDKLKVEFEELRELGIDLDLTGFQLDEIKIILEGEDEGPVYSSKIDAPIYVPQGAQPAVTDLFDYGKALELRAEIAASGLPAEITTFLDMAADRHVVFDFHKIADYYAHAPAEIQRLFEKSALVIVDYESAIENGFVRLTEGLSALADGEADESEAA